MDLISASDVPCCPQLSPEPCCDRLRFDYRLSRPVGDVTVEIKITAEFERCPGPLSLGDLVYSTTLLPGEKVRLFTSSRKNRFTYDAQSEVSYRHEQTSEESFYMSSMDRFMSDLTVTDQGGTDSASQGSFNSSGSVSGALESFFGRPNARVSGSFSGSSSFDFARELRSHAESSHERSVQATRAASSVSVGEVQSRTRIEGASEESYESATRTISNENQCHAVTYFAYQINKSQTVRFRVVAISRRVVDPAGDAVAETLPPRFKGDVQVLPAGVLATAVNRVQVESIGRGASAADRAGIIIVGGAEAQPALGGGLTGVNAGLRANFAATALGQSVAQARLQPLSDAARTRALAQVDRELVAAGLLDAQTGALSREAAAELSFERTTCLPTPALLVKGCLDPCSTCEDARKQSIALDLERKALENKLLARRIELLDKAQEYRCCPAGEHEED